MSYMEKCFNFTALNNWQGQIYSHCALNTDFPGPFRRKLIHWVKRSFYWFPRADICNLSQTVRSKASFPSFSITDVLVDSGASGSLVFLSLGLFISGKSPWSSLSTCLRPGKSHPRSLPPRIRGRACQSIKEGPQTITLERKVLLAAKGKARIEPWRCPAAPWWGGTATKHS